MSERVDDDMEEISDRFVGLILIQLVEQNCY